ncbi:AbrB/MazE/SpoVT family DNA-binding domain-containing protein [Benzoatithermus flavus]|uniref:SpoVT-AbrB domain-containing protein n=1 Tax=Benzoatithermus flavus TaxID=3108223 RepID=A0ABU8XQS5_9PROT
MRASLVRIGNSKGLRTPKPVLEQCGFGNEVELQVEPGRLIVLPAKAHPREGWEQDFAQAEAEPPLLPEDMRARFEEKWTWWVSTRRRGSRCGS